MNHGIGIAFGEVRVINKDDSTRGGVIPNPISIASLFRCMTKLKNQLPLSPLGQPATLTAVRVLMVSLRWIGCWIAHVILIVTIGGIAGTLIAPLVKVALRAQWAWDITFANGAIIGMKYAGLWAMGIALIWCIIRHHKIAQRNSNTAAS